MITRSEGAGLSVAIAAHVVLFGILSLRFLVPATPIKLDNDPIEVAISDDVGLKSAAPEINKEPPAAKLSPVEAPIEDETPPETPPVPDPKPKPDPKPAPKPDPAPDAKPVKPVTPTKTASNTKPVKTPTKPVTASGRLDGLVNGITDQPSKGTSTKPPATVIGADVKSSLVGAIRRMLKPNWKSPTGADVDQLRTFVQVKLDKNGKLLDVKVVKQEGKTELNRPQWDLHAERAVAAVRKTNFDTAILKDEYYSVWGNFVTVFDKRL